ncbi:hypothetical protein J5N97_015585 [Dioscorea zingiberensis]|uniref:Acidic protein n=1 Tax=Dioscorea zingiberensis TaxID=325984 RepID=A0A9D5HER2_9LILI|nr:hypothetical protein J5N97_015585 [Dioscorea zingiberensis]
MEGKGARVPLGPVVMIVLVLGLNLAPTHIEAKSCCVNTFTRNCYDVCRFWGADRDRCAKLCGCIIISDKTCPSDYPKHFTKLGCVSSMCSTISTSQNSDVTKEAAMVGCNNKCSKLYNEEGSNMGSNAVLTP